MTLVERAINGIWSSMQKKCHIIKFGKSGKRPVWKYKLENKIFQVYEKQKETLARRSYQCKKIYSTFANVKAAFIYATEEMVKKMMSLFMRTTLAVVSISMESSSRKYI